MDIDVDDVVFPQPFAEAPAGGYHLQAVLDVHHNYNYSGRVAGDLVSSPVKGLPVKLILRSRRIGGRTTTSCND